MTALYVLMGFIYSLIGIPMIIFGGNQIRIMGILGFIFFAVFAAVYNLLAKWLGGCEFEIKNID